MLRSYIGPMLVGLFLIGLGSSPVGVADNPVVGLNAPETIDSEAATSVESPHARTEATCGLYNHAEVDSKTRSSSTVPTCYVQITEDEDGDGWCFACETSGSGDLCTPCPDEGFCTEEGEN